jgi:ATP-dependent DNA helicase RecQ
VRGFDRPNIYLGVRWFDTEERKRAAILETIASEAKPAIIYTATRKNCEDLAAALSDLDIRALHYHGGMPAKEREAIQNQFMGDQADVIVATNAFGMGVDKPNVRCVFHLDISDSVDSYYQEIGRAGRDGEPAKAILFYRPEDLGVQKFFKSGGRLALNEVRQVIETIEREGGQASLNELKQKTGLSERKVAKALNRLSEHGVLEMERGGEVQLRPEAGDLEEAAREAVAEQDRRREYDKERVEKIRTYAELGSCRRAYLLEYFGEEADAHCGNCDNCLENAALRN